MKDFRGVMKLTIHFYDVEGEDVNDITTGDILEAWENGNAEAWHEEIISIEEQN